MSRVCDCEDCEREARKNTPANQEVIDRARRAAKRGRELRGQWQAYARMMLRNDKLQLAFTSGTPSTDGKTIYLRVPIELGDDTPHDRKACGKRDPDSLRMECGACATLEGVQITMYHEVAHIAFESFSAMTEVDQIDALTEAIRLQAEGKPKSSRAKKLEERFKNKPPKSFIEASNAISPWLGQVVNAGEDGRVNRSMVEARPGTRAMFRAQIKDVFENGMTQQNGETIWWKDQPLNMQAIIGVYCKVSDIEYSTYLDPDVVAKLDDPLLNSLCDDLKTARTARSVFHKSVPVLEKLRELGFCKDKSDLEDDPPAESNKPKNQKDAQESDAEGESDGDGGAGESDDEAGEAGSSQAGEDSEPGDDTDEGGDDAGDGNDEKESDPGGAGGAGGGGAGDAGDDADDETGDGSDDSDGSAGDGSGDEPDEWDGSNPEVNDSGFEGKDFGNPEDVERGFEQFVGHGEDGHVGDSDDDLAAEEVGRALNQEEHFDSPSRAVSGLEVNQFNPTSRTGAWENNIWSKSDPITVPETILAPALSKLRIVFSENKRSKMSRDLRSGQVNGKVLGRRVPTGDDRLFQKKRRPGKRDYFVCIGLDVSGSTSRPGLLDLIKTAAYAKAELCNRLGVKFAVYAHTGDYSYDFRALTVQIYEVKGPNEVWNDTTRQRLYALQPSSVNLDGHTMEFYRKVAQSQSATDKLILYYTDGAMPMENYAEELEILQREIKLCEREQIKIVGVGIKNEDPEKHGLDTIRLDYIEDVPKVVQELEKRLAK